MFYSRELLSRRGPLGTIWLAGNYLRKVSKQQILASDIAEMCHNVVQPPLPLALPTQSTLLRGVVRIENKKAVYLLDAALEAQTVVKLSDRLRTTAETNKIRARSTQTATDKYRDHIQFIVHRSSALICLFCCCQE